MLDSAWWGESFVNELTRISEQAEKKLRVRRQSEFEKTVEEPSNDSSLKVEDGSNASKKPETSRKSISRSHTTA